MDSQDNGDEMLRYHDLIQWVLLVKNLKVSMK